MNRVNKVQTNYITQSISLSGVEYMFTPQKRFKFQSYNYHQVKTQPENVKYVIYLFFMTSHFKTSHAIRLIQYTLK